MLLCESNKCNCQCLLCCWCVWYMIVGVRRNIKLQHCNISGGRLNFWLSACLEKGWGRRAPITKAWSTSHRGRQRPLRLRRPWRWLQRLPHDASVAASRSNLARSGQLSVARFRHAAVFIFIDQLLKHICKEYKKQLPHFKTPALICRETLATIDGKLLVTVSEVEILVVEYFCKRLPSHWSRAGLH